MGILSELYFLRGILYDKGKQVLADTFLAEELDVTISQDLNHVVETSDDVVAKDALHERACASNLSLKNSDKVLYHFSILKR